VLGDAAGRLEGVARALHPAVEDAYAVAKRRSTRDAHLSSTLERFLDDRSALARALIAHRDAVARLTGTLQRLADQQGGRSRPVGTLGGRS
jgi:hypothetical protein